MSHEGGARLEGIIRDELGAVADYALLARDADDDVLRALLLSIVADEFGHARFFSLLQHARREGH